MRGLKILVIFGLVGVLVGLTVLAADPTVRVGLATIGNNKLNVNISGIDTDGDLVHLRVVLYNDTTGKHNIVIDKTYPGVRYAATASVTLPCTTGNTYYAVGGAQDRAGNTSGDYTSNKVSCIKTFVVVGDQLINYHWWTAGGEKEAIDAVFALYQTVYPQIELVENPTSGGGGGIMRAQIKNMILAGNAPDTFQLTYGSGMLASFVDALEPIDDIWGDLPVPAKIKEMGTIDGHQYGIPLNIMRNNCLWYNTKLVKELGIQMPLKTLDDFFAACEKAKDAGYSAYAIGAGAGQEFWFAHIFEQFLLAVPRGGPAYLERLYAGEADPANDPAIREVLEAWKRLKENGYVNADYGALTWDQAGDLLVSKKAVFCQMGDWMKGHFTSLGWTSGVEFNYQPSPGTDGMFTLHLDCFVLPKGAPHPTAARKWLRLLATKEAETAFCPIKGATPPRLDAFTDMYDAISQNILAAFRAPSTTIVESAWAAPPEAWLGTYGSMLSGFFEKPDVNQGVKDFAEAYDIVFE